MHRAGHAHHLDAAREASVAGGNPDARALVKASAPLLFALAARYPLLDAEEAVAAVLTDLLGPSGRRPRQLPVRVWVTGVALRRFGRLGGRLAVTAEASPEDVMRLAVRA